MRLLRQGINRKAYWFVSLSIPIGFEGDRPDLFAALAVIKIDSKTGQVVENKQQDPEETKKAKQEAAERDEDDLVEEKLQGVGEQ